MFLSYAGSDKKADDLFEFKIEISESTLERIWESISEDDDEDNKFHEDIQKIDEEKDYKKANKLQREFVVKKIKSGEIKVKDYDDDYYGYNEDYLIMIPKENSEETINLTAKFEGIFNIEASYQ